MSFLEMGRSLGLGRRPAPPMTYGVYRVQRPAPAPGARDGSFVVPAPRPRFDTRPPLLNVFQWTPGGWEPPAVGSNMERF
jgi:hypothetical protein